MWTAPDITLVLVAFALGYIAHATYQARARKRAEVRSTAPLSATRPPQHNVTETNIRDARAEFIAIVGPKQVISSASERRAHSHTPWSSGSASQTPDLIVYPGSTAEVSAIMQVCSRRRLPVTGFSGGTSLPGALTATRRGVCVDFARMNRVLAVHADDRDVVVQPGVDWQELNAQLESQGLFFPLDPGPGARIGGMIAMNCSGTNAYRYGTLKEWVISMTLVLADGIVVKTRHRPCKSSAGYNLTGLMVGSEGTLGLVTEAVLKVTSAPVNLHVAVATFHNTRAAVETAICLIGENPPVDALELLDQYSMRAINLYGLSQRQWSERPTLFLKFSGSPYTVSDQVRRARIAATKNQCETYELLAEKDEIEASWGVRKSVGKSLYAMKTDATDLFLTADAAVPISRLADMIDETHQAIAEAGLVGSTLGHVGDGNFHTVIVCPLARQEIARKLIANIQLRAVQLEGTITGEHGIGLGLRDMLVHEVGQNSVDLMRKIKLALDPQCILNCDKVICVEKGH